MNYKASDTLEAETKLLFNLDEHLSYVIKPEIHYDINDKLKLTFGVDFIEGVQDTFLASLAMTIEVIFSYGIVFNSPCCSTPF